jgi:hypothetical protein
MLSIIAVQKVKGTLVTEQRRTLTARVASVILSRGIGSWFVSNLHSTSVSLLKLDIKAKLGSVPKCPLCSLILSQHR